MLFTPTRRLAAGATAAAILAGAFLIPAAVVVAEELPDAVTASVEAPTDDTPAAPEPSADASAEPVAGADPEQLPEPAEPREAPATPQSAAPASVALAPTASLAGTAASIGPGQTWTAQIAVDDATSLRAVAVGTDLVLTVTDEAGATGTATGVTGSADIYLVTSVPDGLVDIAIRNTGTTTRSIPYAFGWETRDIRASASMSEGIPTLRVATYPSRGGVPQTGTGTVSAIGTDGVVHTLPIGGPSYVAEFSDLAPGTYAVELDMIVLGVHRYSARVSRVAAAETTPPTVTLTTTQQPAAGGWFPGAVDLQITATDAGSGVHFLRWAVDSSQLAEVNLTRVTTRIIEEGAHQVRYEAEDWQGNKTGLVTRQINIDHSKPTLVLNGIADGDTFDQDERVAIEYLCDDALSGVQSCVGDIASGDFLDTTTPGAHSIRVTATDKAGNETVVERGYTVREPDTTDPEIVVDVPPVPASGWYLDTVTVRLTASDENGIRRIHYEYDTMQGTVRRDVEADTAEITFDRSQLYTLSYWAEDTAGNRSEGRDLQLYVDATAPWIDLMSPDEDELSILPNGHVAQNERIVVDFSCDDDASGIESCDATTPDGELLPTGTPGVHELRIVATDVAGHRTERVVRYTVDAAPASGGAGGSGAPRLASTGADAAGPAVVIAGLLLAAGAALTARRRVRER